MKPVQRVTLTNVLLSVAFLFFTFGVFSPLMTVKTWFIFTHTFSLPTGLMQFFQAKQYVLFVLVTTFSLVVPLAKIILVAFAANTSCRTPSAHVSMLHWVALCGKWAMMDVFIVAILVVVGKIRGFAEVELHSGLYAFAASVILIHLVTCRLDTRMRRLA